MNDEPPQSSTHDICCPICGREPVWDVRIADHRTVWLRCPRGHRECGGSTERAALEAWTTPLTSAVNRPPNVSRRSK